MECKDISNLLKIIDIKINTIKESKISKSNRVPRKSSLYLVAHKDLILDKISMGQNFFQFKLIQEFLRFPKYKSFFNSLIHTQMKAQF